MKVDNHYNLFTYKKNGISTNLLDLDLQELPVRPEIVQEPSMQGHSFVWIRKTNDQQYVTLQTKICTSTQFYNRETFSCEKCP